MAQVITVDKLTDLVDHKRLIIRERPVIIAVSGFGGAGKSTIANHIRLNVEDSEVISIDEFITNRMPESSSNWSLFDYSRFKKQVLEQAIDGKPIVYGIFDWDSLCINHSQQITAERCLIVEGCGILQPELMPFYDISIWLDVPLGVATKQGIARDSRNGADHEALWTTVWEPNERDFFDRFRPDELAEYWVIPANLIVS